MTRGLIIRDETRIRFTINKSLLNAMKSADNIVDKTELYNNTIERMRIKEIKVNTVYPKL